MIEDEESAAPPRLDAVRLELLSVADLQTRIDMLQAQIDRARAAIAQKQGARGHADSFFRKP